MPRKPLIRTAEFPYHVTTRSNNRDWFAIPLPEVWRFCQELLREGEKEHKIQVEAFVLMNNHYHLCLYTPEANIDEFMRFFNQSLGRKIAKQSGRINRVFGATYKWTLIRDQAYFYNVIRYVYQNPMRAQLCLRCEDYPFSDLKKQKLEKDLLNWINRPLNEFDRDRTKKRLRRYEI